VEEVEEAAEVVEAEEEEEVVVTERPHRNGPRRNPG
jgi:hypothetical protein